MLRWTARMAFVVAIIVLVLGAAAPPIESQGVLPHVTVTLTEPAPIAIGSVDYEHVQVEGEVAYGYLPKNTVIEVTATTDNYWNVTISPTKVTVTGSFPASGSFKVSMDVRVPPKASADRPGVLTVEAIATSPPPLSVNTSALASTNIRVKQYYGLRLDTNHTVAVDQGRAVTNRFRVTNIGNGNDNFTIALTNAAEVRARGLTMQFESAVLGLGQDRALAVRIDINASKNATVGSSNAVFKVTSQGDPAQTDMFTLTVIVREYNSTDGGGDGTTDGKKKSPGPAAVTALAAIVAVALALVATRRRRRA